MKTLEERYAEPLPQLMQEVEALAHKVDEHLKKMGLEWNQALVLPRREQ